ncbi:MAG: bacterial transcriptional activator domain-containing protein [Anaerolineae bacterium]|nr:bacterial transcriptional activator domain-containing protein [Anaerolineae bacterium]
MQLDPQAPVWLDVEAFERYLADDERSSLEQAVALYRGDLLEGLDDGWTIQDRYRCQRLFAEALARLAVLHEAAGDHQAALDTAQRLIEYDPLREDAHRAAMRACCRLGRRNAALEQYRRCRDVIAAELGVEPMTETIALYEAILSGDLDVAAISAPP